MTPIVVTLTREEMIFAAQGAVVRNIDAILKGRKTIFGNPQEELWVRHIIGCMGECAVAKHADRYWTPLHVRPTGVPDLGKKTEVRSSTRLDSPLRLYDRDRDERPFVLVLVEAPKFTLVGWLYGHEAKRDEFERTRGDAERTWSVPQASLRPLDPEEN